jgi:ATP-binding cassette subfamily B protein
MSGRHSGGLGADHGSILDVEVAKRLWFYTSRRKLPLLAAAALLPVATWLHLMVPALLQRGIDGPMADRDLDGLWSLGLVLVAVAVLGHIATLGQTLLTQWVGQWVVHDLRVEAHRHMQSLSLRFFETNPTGRLLTRLTNDLEGVGQMFAAGILGVIGDLLKLAGICLAIFLLDRRLALIVFALMPLLLVVAHGFRVLMRDAYRTIRRRTASLNSNLQERIAGMKIVQLFVQEERTRKEFEGLNRSLMLENFRAIRLDASLYAVVDMMGSVVIAVVLWRAAGPALQQVVTVGVLVAFVEYLRRFFEPVRDLSMKFATLQAGIAGAEKVFVLLDETDRIQAAVVEAVPVVSLEAPDLRFERLSFAYDPHKPVLRDLNLRIEAGRSLALLGPTGAGKSTLLKLLVREMDADRGLVLLGGHDVRSMPLALLRSQVGFVPQHVQFFSESLRANLDPHGRCSDAELTEILDAVGVANIVERLGGLDGILVERGTQLSLGERQLLAFARVLAYDPRVLLLDEATANLDTFSERRVQAAIAHIMRGRTTLVVAHRLSTVRHVNRVAVMREGQVVEEGSHEELLDLGGIYSDYHRRYYGVA